MNKLVRKLLLCGILEKGVALTGVKQLDLSSPHVSCFICEPFVLTKTSLLVAENWDSVLTDILLGLCLCQMRTGIERNLEITLFLDSKKESERIQKIQTFLTQRPKWVTSIRFREFGQAAEPDEDAFCRWVWMNAEKRKKE